MTVYCGTARGVEFRQKGLFQCKEVVVFLFCLSFYLYFILFFYSMFKVFEIAPPPPPVTTTTTTTTTTTNNNSKNRKYKREYKTPSRAAQSRAPTPARITRIATFVLISFQHLSLFLYPAWSESHKIVVYLRGVLAPSLQSKDKGGAFSLTSQQQREEAREILAKEVQANTSAGATFLESGGKSIGLRCRLWLPWSLMKSDGFKARVFHVSQPQPPRGP